MNKPPEHVKMAMEAVILMVRPDIPPATINWESVRKVMRDANFIPSILEYDARQELQHRHGNVSHSQQPSCEDYGVSFGYGLEESFTSPTAITLE